MNLVKEAEMSGQQLAAAKVRLHRLNERRAQAAAAAAASNRQIVIMYGS
jgi:hypothetical protein